MKQALRHGVATTAMFFGSALVLGFLILMNEYSKPPQKEDKDATVTFEVEKKKPPKKQQRRKPKPRRVERSMPKRAPVPELTSSISDVTLEIPGFDGSQLGELSEQVLGQTSKKMVMDEGSVDEPPKAVTRVPPDEYPPKARKAGITGFVTMNLLIGADGEVERVKVLDAKPPGVFEEVAMATIRRWRFEPAVYQSEHVRVWAKQTMRFKLN